MTTSVGTTRFSVLAIVGFILSFVVSIVGAIICLVAYMQIRHSGQRGARLAVAGMIIGVVFFILGIIGLVAGINAHMAQSH